MGFFSRLIGGQSDHDRRIEDAYVQAFVTTGMPLAEAQKTIRDLIKKAKDETRRDGTAKMSTVMGDWLLTQEHTGTPQIRENLAKKRKEGVTDADIKWWWNRLAWERVAFEKHGELCRMAMFLHELDRGVTPEQAALKVRQYHPIYGDPDDTSKTKGDDRPLPCELKDRVDLSIQMRIQKDPVGYKSEMENSSSFNALIRKAIRSGEI